MAENHVSKHLISVARTARYFTLNSITPQTKKIWIVFHGYGQLGEYFIRHFNSLNPDENAIIALEGLSRFYVEGLSGRVGASWMTKENREEEVTDQWVYINAVLQDCGIDITDQRLVILGFSQGTATAIRWMAKHHIRAKQLVIWAGQWPHDVALHDMQPLLTNTKIDFCIGTQDEFITPSHVEERMEELKKFLPQLDVHWFDGKHVMHAKTLLHVAST